MTADEIRHAYQGSQDLHADILAEIAAQLAELNQRLRGWDSNRGELTVITTGVQP